MTVGEICTILGVLLSALATVSAIMHNNKQAKDNYFRQMQENKDELLKLTGKIDALAEKVQKHNNMVERTYHLESEMAKTSAQIDELRHDVRDLKQMKG